MSTFNQHLMFQYKQQCIADEKEWAHIDAMLKNWKFEYVTEGNQEIEYRTSRVTGKSIRTIIN